MTSTFSFSFCNFCAGAKLPNIVILLPTESIQIQSPAGEKVISVAGR